MAAVGNMIRQDGALVVTGVVAVVSAVNAAFVPVFARDDAVYRLD